MDNRKYEKLINLIINEDDTGARALFHDIVVEKSREIFESIMAEEFEDDMDEGMDGQVGEMMDEINAEESGMTEEDEDLDFDSDDDDFGGDDDFDSDDDDDFGAGDDEFGGEEGAEGEEIEDAVIRIEDKLDQLMAEFDEIMGHEDEAGEEDFDADGGEFGDDEGDDDEDFGGEDDDDEEAMMEAINLQKVSVTHGDNGVQTKSPVTFNSGQNGMDSKPVKFSGAAEANPTGAKKPSNYATKGEGDLPGAGKFKNTPAVKSRNLDSAPKPKKGDDGSNHKSPIAEAKRGPSRSITRRPTR